MKGFLGRLVAPIAALVGAAVRLGPQNPETDRPRASLPQMEDMDLPPLRRRKDGGFVPDVHRSGLAVWPAHAAPSWAGCKLAKRFSEASSRSTRGY